MLLLKTTCENCKKQLSYYSEEAFICSFECTFCIECTITILKNICPNCKGNLVKRPTRPEHLIEKYPQRNSE